MASVFGHTNNNADKSPFGTQASSPEGSTSVFGASSSPTFGTSPFGGSSVFGQNPAASERSGFTFGNPFQISQPTMGVFGTPPLETSWKPAFGDSNSTFGSTTSAYCSTGSSFSFASAPAFDHSPTPFGARSTTPAFGNPFASQYNQPSSSAQRNPFGAHATQPAFVNPGFGKVYQPPVGSRWCSYAETQPEAEDCENHLGWKLVSISAMAPYKEKSHEELRWEDYQKGDKGSPNPAGQSCDETEFKTNNMRSNLFSTNPFAHPTFGTPGFVKSSPVWPPTTSNPSAPPQSQTPSPNPFGPAQAQTPSVFYTTPSNPFGPPSSSIPTFGVSVAFGAPTAFGATSYSFSFSFTPVFGQSTSASGINNPFGAQSSPFGTHAAAPK